MFKTNLLLPVLCSLLSVQADKLTALLPTSSSPSTTFETGTLDGTQLTWSATNSSTGLPAAWRIAGDSSSAVLLNYTSAASTGSDPLYKVSVSTTYGGSASQAVTPGVAVSIPVSRSLFVRNLYCQDSQNFTAIVTYSNGTTHRGTAIDRLHIALDDNAVSASIQEIDLGGIGPFDPFTVLLGTPKLTATFASTSNVPSIAAQVVLGVDFCTEDD